MIGRLRVLALLKRRRRGGRAACAGKLINTRVADVRRAGDFQFAADDFGHAPRHREAET